MEAVMVTHQEHVSNRALGSWYTVYGVFHVAFGLVASLHQCVLSPTGCACGSPTRLLPRYLARSAELYAGDPEGLSRRVLIGSCTWACVRGYCSRSIE